MTYKLLLWCALSNLMLQASGITTPTGFRSVEDVLRDSVIVAVVEVTDLGVGEFFSRAGGEIFVPGEITIAEVEVINVLKGDENVEGKNRTIRGAYPGRGDFRGYGIVNRFGVSGYSREEVLENENEPVFLEGGEEDWFSPLSDVLEMGGGIVIGGRVVVLVDAIAENEDWIVVELPNFLPNGGGMSQYGDTESGFSGLSIEETVSQMRALINSDLDDSSKSEAKVIPATGLNLGETAADVPIVTEDLGLTGSVQSEGGGGILENDAAAKGAQSGAEYFARVVMIWLAAGICVVGIAWLIIKLKRKIFRK